MSDIPLAQELNISHKEWYSTAEQIKFMLDIRAKGNGRITEQQASKIFDEWVQVAKRLNKGGSMIQQTAALLNGKDDQTLMKRMDALVSLFMFLHSLLGFYDMYFKMTVDEDEYLRLQSSILEILKTKTF